ncbi:MAG: ABC transporter ATP-binding protein [Bifidobacteriaceae bacterium]|jgi:putative ABC transport system ATP-binding protein|nr:ABC transporter ATP-binding protein [Bifidobacteriaceae bacterium]
MVSQLKAYKVFKKYGKAETEVVALDYVDVEISQGQFTAIMGPSGSGKSTLMHTLAGLDSINSGEIFLNNIKISNLSQKKLTKIRRDNIGFIFQQFNLVPTLNARENITLPLDIAHKKVDFEWFDKIVNIFGIKDRLKHRPSELSGGQQQRVACARALVTRPAIIFADEPTGNLDSKSSGEVLNFLKQSVDEFGQTLVLVTHNPRAASYADRVLVLADGKIIHDLAKPSYDQVLQVFKE